MQDFVVFLHLLSRLDVFQSKLKWIDILFSLLLGQFFFDSFGCAFAKLAMTFIMCSLRD